MTLTDFLLARISEDEEVAREGGRWDGGMEIAWRDVGGISESLIIGTDRVLAECESKRRIVDMYAARSEQDHLTVQAHATGLLLAMRALAAVYASHPDYDPSWTA